MVKSLALLYLLGSILCGDVFAQNQTVTNGSVTAPIPFTGAGCTFNWTNDQPSIGLAVSGVGNIASFTATNTGSTPVVATITVAPVSQFYAYIPNEQDNTVSVVNAVSGSIVATVPVGELPDAESVSPDGSTVYISNEASDNVSVISTATNTVIATIPIGFSARGIVVNHAGTMVYVADGRDVKVISTATNTVVGTLSSGAPVGITIDPSDAYVYTVDYASPGIVKQIDVASNATTFSASAGNESYGVSISPDGSRLYVTNTQGASVTVIDVATQLVIATIPVGRVPSQSVVSPDGKTVYVTNSVGGTVSVIDASTNTVTATVPCSGANTPNISADGKVLYVTAGNNLIAFSTATNAVLWTTPVGQGPQAIGNYLTPATCGSAPSTFTITVNPTPNVSATVSTGYIFACAGSPSASPAIRQFTVSAMAATDNVVAVAPAGFEVSITPNGGYGNSVTLIPAAGVLNQPVYVRSAASASAGYMAGVVILTEGGVTEQTVGVTGVVNTPAALDQPSGQIVENGTSTAAVNFTPTGSTVTWTNNTPSIGLAASGTGDIAAFTASNLTAAPVTATISATPAPMAYAYVPNHADNTVSVVNTAANSVVATVRVDDQPNAVALTPDGLWAYVANIGSDDVSVINTTTNFVVATIPIYNEALSVVVNHAGSVVYVTTQDGIKAISVAGNNVIATYNVPGFISAIVIDPTDKFAYTIDYNNPGAIAKVDLINNVIAASCATGSYPRSLTISPDGSRLYVTNSQSASVTVVDAASMITIATIPVGNTPKGSAISPDGNTLYVTNNADGTISVINTASNAVTGTITCGAAPFGINTSADGNILYLTVGNTFEAISTVTQVILSSTPVGEDPYANGNFLTPSACSSTTATFTITVNPTAPAITVTGTPVSMTTVYGTPSAADNFAVSGTNLTADILITPPQGLEVSTDGATFSNAVTIDLAATVAPTTIYIRLAATTPVSSYTGNVTITSDGATTQNLAIPASTVTPAALTITANDASRPYGQANPLFTFTYSEFQNNETEASLIAPPQGTTAATESSPAGDYPILASGAEDSNYRFTYAPGTLKITPVSMAVSIPSAFTPNGDGKNDTWGIKNLSKYPNCKVTVFNRYGQAVFTSTGYGEPWNGRQNGSDLAAGTYVYAIDLGNGSNALTGTVMIIR